MDMIFFFVLSLILKLPDNTDCFTLIPPVGSCDLVGKFGTDCMLSCHCLNSTECNNKSGQCTNGCLPGWSGPICQKENIAFNSNTFQKDGSGSVDSSLAVDNDVNTCSASKSEISGWWTVGLHEKQIVHAIKITSDANASLHGWKVIVGDTSNIFSMRLCSYIGVYKNIAQITCDTREQARYITVINPAGPVIICEFQVFVCSFGSFGVDCEYQCGCKNRSEQCDVIYGTCSQSGCRNGRSGADCQTECVSSYGPNCINKCGQCLNDTDCNHDSGVCQLGCQRGWYGDRCDKICMDGFYGHNCSRHCGHCYDNEICDQVNGTCTSGCQTGWSGQNCDKECDNGFYGENCVFKCGSCSSGKTCDPFTGICDGCLPGWKGRFCTQPCDIGSYGYNCNGSCLNCDKTFCHAVTGVCQMGCQPGWKGGLCNVSCSSGRYGPDCNHTCGNCINGDCNMANGTCMMGCESGYMGELCISKKQVFSDKASTQMASFLGASVPIVVIIMIILICCLIFKWRQEDIFDITTQCEKDKLTPQIKTTEEIVI